MNENDLKIVCDFAMEQSGIVLNPSKAYLVESRLGALAVEHGFVDIGALARALKLAPKNVQIDVIDALTTNETFFFRDKTPFNLFEETILPSLVKSRTAGGKIRIWCAAASTGQEPYSLAMLLLKHKRMLGLRSVEILATDISSAAVKRAKDGIFTQFEVQRGLPVQMLMAHFTQDGTHWQISDEVRNMVKFTELNLMRPFAHVGLMDVIYCRNVLIYFNSDTKRKVLDGVAKLLRPDGFLVMGAAETMMGHSEKFERADTKRGLYQPASIATAARLSA